MERVAGSILLRLHQENRLVAADQVPQVWMCVIGVDKPSLGHHESRAVHLDCRLPGEMSVDGGVPPSTPSAPTMPVSMAAPDCMPARSGIRPLSGKYMISISRACP